MIEITGSQSKLSAFLSLLEDYEIFICRWRIKGISAKCKLRPDPIFILWIGADGFPRRLLVVVRYQGAGIFPCALRYKRSCHAVGNQKPGERREHEARTLRKALICSSIDCDDSGDCLNELKQSPAFSGTADGRRSNSGFVVRFLSNL